MIKKLLFTAALLVPGLAYGQNTSAGLSVQVVPGSNPPNGIVCAIGPNSSSGPTGVAATDAQTAGFTTCALNSDFSTSTYSNVNTFIDSCGATRPIWFNRASNTTAVPCSDYNIITDGANGQVLDITYTNADYSAGRGGAQLLSGFIGGPGQIYPTGMYIEFRYRFSTNTMTAFNSSTNTQGWDTQGLFKFVPNGFGSAPAIEWDFDEGFIFDNANGGGISYRGATGPIGSTSMPSFPPKNNSSNYWCTRSSDPAGGVPCGTGQAGGNFDMTVMHTYGYLVTTDGNQSMSVCYYVDRTPGAFTKLGCYNYTGISPATTPLQALETFILFLGPGAPPLPNSFNGPADSYYQYIRVFTCPTWNHFASGSSTTTNVCSGPLVTQ
jgi:hypothetical protein